MVDFITDLMSLFAFVFMPVSLVYEIGLRLGIIVFGAVVGIATYAGSGLAGQEDKR